MNDYDFTTPIIVAAFIIATIAIGIGIAIGWAIAH